jgi:hypothetical protein
MPDSAEQDSISAEAGIEGSLRQRIAVTFDRDSAYIGIAIGEGVAKTITHGLQHLYRLRSYFRADAVAGEYGYMFGCAHKI